MGFLRMAAAKSPVVPLYERGDVAVQHCARDADILGNASSREAESYTWAPRHGKSPHGRYGLRRYTAITSVDTSRP
jgi:hypothetical protein